jgi:hypothetical protein
MDLSMVEDYTFENRAQFQEVADKLTSKDKRWRKIVDRYIEYIESLFDHIKGMPITGGKVYLFARQEMQREHLRGSRTAKRCRSTEGTSLGLSSILSVRASLADCARASTYALIRF